MIAISCDGFGPYHYVWIPEQFLPSRRAIRRSRAGDPAMNRITVWSIAAVTWLFVLSTTLSAILWLVLRIARAKNRAEARASWLFELADQREGPHLLR
jgi:hypothetical protein